MSGDSADQYLGVRDAARRLGVHENTLRNWVRDGLLADVRVPGSRYLRVSATDVERLLAQRGAAAPTLQADRRVVRNQLADAGQLTVWPDERPRDSQERFPELVQRLLLETPGVTGVRVETRDGISEPGYDGVATVRTETALLPVGELVIEMGVSKDVARKANSDYGKRIRRVGRGRESFVFITPRRWRDGQRWAAERRAEGEFSDVRVIDAPMLETWLRVCPGAHHWVSEHLGLRPKEAVSMDEWWSRFSQTASPSLPLALFAAGRQAECRRLRELLKSRDRAASSGSVALAGDPSDDATSRHIIIESEWADDVYAFVHASLQNVENNDDRLVPDLEGVDEPQNSIPEPLLVSTPGTWDRIVGAPGRSLLVPTFHGADITTALVRGHSVITVIDKTMAKPATVDISLPRISRREASDAFSATGADLDDADRWAALGRRSLPALIRGLSRDPRRNRPPWAEGDRAHLLGPLTLVETWTEGLGDLEVIEQLCGTSWTELEPILYDLSRVDDPMFRRTDDHWQLVAPEEALLAAMDSLATSALTRWAETAAVALLKPDPFARLNQSDSLRAQMDGLRPPVSSVLRRGIASGLALAASLEVLASTSPAAKAVSTMGERIASRVLAAAMQDDSGDSWLVIAPHLPLLAEAAPERLLDQLETDLDRNRPSVTALFDPSTEDVFTSTSLSVHLLWALETLSWSEEYLVTGCRLLARLVAIEDAARAASSSDRPRSTNHPKNSISTVLQGWVRNTAGTVPTKMRALDAVTHVSTDLGWEILMRLWPTRRSTSFPPSRPRFQDWPPSTTRVRLSEWSNFVDGLVVRGIDQAGTDPRRLADLLERLAPLPQPHRDRVLDALDDAVERNAVLGDGTLLLWEAAKDVEGKHRRFPDAEWAMPDSDVSRVESLAERLTPINDPRRFARLFVRNAELGIGPGGGPGSQRRHVNALRVEALSVIAQEPNWLEVLASIAERADTPEILGWTLVEVPNVNTDDLIACLDSPSSHMRAVANSWLRRWLSLNADKMLPRLLARTDLSSDTRKAIVLATPAVASLWRQFDSRPADADTYWQQASFDVVDEDDVVEAVERLLGRDRAWAAISVCAYALEEPHRPADSDSPLSPELVERVLVAAATEHEPADDDVSSSTAYLVGQLLDHMSAQGVAEDRLARLEFLFLRFLEHTRSPVAMSHVLETDPAVFVDLVRRAFRAASDSPSDQSSEVDGLATQSWLMLEDWRGHPGRQADGTTDGQALDEWVASARLQLSELDRADIGDELIGRTFASAAQDEEGIWPPLPVRDLIERLGSRQLEHGVVLGRLNARGVTVRRPHDGGDIERREAATYRELSRRTSDRWPRTSRILRDIARTYEVDAEREDRRATLDADRG